MDNLFVCASDQPSSSARSSCCGSEWVRSVNALSLGERIPSCCQALVCTVMARWPSNTCFGSVRNVCFVVGKWLEQKTNATNTHSNKKGSRNAEAHCERLKNKAQGSTTAKEGTGPEQLQAMRDKGMFTL
ncbi:unnamed protein product [Polarella glacialis]|uniref:Uncharacterized protein n=1 Tax=Polarella glacialis TaxID=89957 RepID=A0A813I1E1_POLGL|nr:unnamed protein product [Polarella glacialis]